MRRARKVVLILALMAVGAVAYAWQPAPGDIMTYKVTAEPGDTVWSICSRIATDRDNMQQVVWQAMKDSHIEKASDLQPGQIVVVRVKAVE